jgi:hypothetical protein
MIRNFLVALAATTMLVQPVLAQTGAVPATQPASFAALVSQVQVPYEQFTLPNGLRVIVHTDRKAPIVAVSVWYHIGSKDEPRGKTGFAHLFEHLMFYGSENNDGVFFKKLEDVGATDANGTTWFDRTNYFENVPTQALDLALYLESPLNYVLRVKYSHHYLKSVCLEPPLYAVRVKHCHELQKDVKH